MMLFTGEEGFDSIPKSNSTLMDLGLTLGCPGASSSFQSSSSSSSSIHNHHHNADSLVATATIASQAVGWPPVAAYRMNSFTNQTKSPEDFNSTDQTKSPQDFNSTNDKSSRSKSSFVKVNKDGIPIGRKVDLNAHSCYQTLARTLEVMFSKPPAIKTSNTMVEARRPSKLLDGSSDFVLTYQDKDGDLMLVGDVPWGMFLNSVKRLRIMRASDANGLAPRLQDMTRRRKSNPI